MTVANLLWYYFFFSSSFSFSTFCLGSSWFSSHFFLLVLAIFVPFFAPSVSLIVYFSIIVQTPHCSLPVALLWWFLRWRHAVRKVIYGTNHPDRKNKCVHSLYLADPGKASGCSTNTSVIDWLIDWLINWSLSLPQLYSATTSKRLEIDLGLF